MSSSSFNFTPPCPHYTYPFPLWRETQKLSLKFFQAEHLWLKSSYFTEFDLTLYFTITVNVRGHNRSRQMSGRILICFVKGIIIPGILFYQGRTGGKSHLDRKIKKTIIGSSGGIDRWIASKFLATTSVFFFWFVAAFSLFGNVSYYKTAS